MKLSIITINYNHLEGLKKTYESVIGQTWTDYEWIVVDGGSTDGSRQFIEVHQARFAYWCSEPDGGVYAAQNKGLSKAGGEYVNFLNAGDVYANAGVLATVFGQERSADILFGFMMRKTQTGEPHNFPSMKPHLYWEDFYFDTIPHQSAYIRRSLFDEYGYYDESYTRLADWKWFQRVIAFCQASVEFIPHKLSVYECGGISEGNHWQEDLFRLRQESFPACIPEADFQNLRDIHAIWEHRWSRFLYRVVRRMVHSYDWMCKKRLIERVRLEK